MICTDVRTLLPGFLYGDLKPEEVAGVEQHLTTCPACRKERADLERVRQALTAVPAPAIEIDLPQLFRRAADRQARRARRWRRAALACGAVAAILLIAVGLRLEVRVEASQLVFRWGSPPAEKIEPAPHKARSQPAAADPAKTRPGPDLERHLQLLDDLIHALAEDVESRDQKHQVMLARLQAGLDILAGQASRQWSETERNVAALYVAHTLLAKKGKEP